MHHEPLLDVVELDLRFVEMMMDGEHEAQVSFPLAGLLTELRTSIGGIKDGMATLPTKTDLQASEQRQSERMARMEADINKLKQDSLTAQVQWGKLMGAAAVVALFAGSIGAVLTRLVGA